MAGFSLFIKQCYHNVYLFIFIFTLTKLEFGFTSHVSMDYLHQLKTFLQINITE